MDKNNPNGNAQDNKDEDLSALISNAIENKKILEQSENTPEILAARTGEIDLNKAAAEKKEGVKTGEDSANKKASLQGNNKDKAEKKPAENQNNKKNSSAPKQNTNKKETSVNNNLSKDSKPQKKQNNQEKNLNKNKKSSKSGNKKQRWDFKKKTGVTLGIIFLVIVIIAAIAVGLFFHYTGLLNRKKDNKVNSGKAPIDSSLIVNEADTFDKEKKDEELKKQLANRSQPISDENVMNILLIGEDLRDTEEDNRGNTDVMMLISINKSNKTITMTSLMRDMYVYLDGYESNKLNSAYWHEGSELLEKTIENYFGVGIDRYVMVNFYTFIDIVDAVGGIDIDVKLDEAEGMKDPMDEQNKYLGNKHDTDYLTKGGMQHLNGNQALAYARLRYVGNADFERTQRQRRVINEIISKAKSLSLFELDKLANKVFPQVNTDLTNGELASLLYNAFDFMNYDIQEVRIPADGYYTNEVIDQMDVLMPDYAANAAIMQKIIYGEAKTVEEAAKQYEEELANGETNSYNSMNNAYGYNDGYNYGYNYGY